jgi:hypothetical protein
MLPTLLVASDKSIIETRANSPPGYSETSEYLIGDVAVGIIFLESNGTIDPSTEDWTSDREQLVINEITTGLNWLENQNPNASVNFIFDIHYRVPTSYEPISHSSGGRGAVWIDDAMAYLGYSPAPFDTRIRDYANDLRNTLGTDWAFVMFIIDSYNDPDGDFTNGMHAFAFWGGPLMAMTYDNGNRGIENMDYVVAHETCHIFWATDEYDGKTETSGYLGVQDLEGSGCLMDIKSWWLCTNSKEQLGWRDSDGDGIQDVVDTFPDTTLNPYSPNPTADTTLMYTGLVAEIPYPNNNPHYLASGNDVTINTITNVEFRVDFGNWMSAVSNDGIFDEDEEDFMFTIPQLSEGTHTIEVRGINSVGNIETSYSSDTVIIAIEPTPTPSSTPTPTPTPTPTATPTPTPSPSPSPSPSPTPSPAPSPTPTSSPTPTPTPTTNPTPTPTLTPTPTPTSAPTPTPIIPTPTPTSSPLSTPSPTPSVSPTQTPELTPVPSPTPEPPPESGFSLPLEYIVGGIAALVFVVIGIFFLTRK